MYQGTTPTLILTVGQVDLTGMTVYVTIESENKKIITKSGSELVVNNNEVAVRLVDPEDHVRLAFWVPEHMPESSRPDHQYSVYAQPQL